MKHVQREMPHMFYMFPLVMLRGTYTMKITLVKSYVGAHGCDALQLEPITK